MFRGILASTQRNAFGECDEKLPVPIEYVINGICPKQTASAMKKKQEITANIRNSQTATATIHLAVHPSLADSWVLCWTLLVMDQPAEMFVCLIGVGPRGLCHYTRPAMAFVQANMAAASRPWGSGLLKPCTSVGKQ